MKVRTERRHKRPTRAAMTIVFTITVFIVLTMTMLVVFGVVLLLVRAGVLGTGRAQDIPIGIIVIAISSVVIGTIIAAVFGRVPMRPMNKLIGGMNSLAEGKYDTRIDFGEHPLGKELARSFNALAEELGSTELLRSDFVNNFSHEFKTPIVSIRGFAKLLRKGCVTEEQRAEYLDIIVEESSRLADMATNVLNLTKVENQSILTDLTDFNLSEQIRNSVLLLEKKWTAKDITVSAEFGECYIHANEELLKHVWINLIDNAVKFAPRGGEVEIKISQSEDKTTVFVKNNGPQIEPVELERIFNKFYQGDASHASEGTGIGLAVAKRITELHKGKITAASSPERTVFTVILPEKTYSEVT